MKPRSRSSAPAAPGRFAALRARRHGLAWKPQTASEALDRLGRAAAGRKGGVAAVTLLEELRALMGSAVGPLRTESGLSDALARIGAMRQALTEVTIAEEGSFNVTLADWFDLRASLLVAEAVARAALGRKESRGIHEREDFPESDPALARAQFVRMDRAGAIRTRFVA